MGWCSLFIHLLVFCCCCYNFQSSSMIKKAFYIVLLFIYFCFQFCFLRCKKNPYTMVAGGTLLSHAGERSGGKSCCSSLWCAGEVKIGSIPHATVLLCLWETLCRPPRQDGWSQLWLRNGGSDECGICLCNSPCRDIRCVNWWNFVSEGHRFLFCFQ